MVNILLKHHPMNNEGTKLYFASDMPGGFGGLDLYAADVLADGTLANITNLGATVNSAQNEKHPYINGHYIFFSSEGHETYGGYDVFRASMTDKGITNRTNIGKYIKHSKRRSSFYFKRPEQRLYFF